MYIYNDIDKLLSDRMFNNFDKADYTILGSMSPNAVEEYEETKTRYDFLSNQLTDLDTAKSNCKRLLLKWIRP